MSAPRLLVDLLGLLLALAGFRIAFRQKRVRRWLDRMRVRQGRPPLAAAPTGGAEDPLYFAMSIFGTMSMACGFSVIGFSTMFAITTGR